MVELPKNFKVVLTALGLVPSGGGVPQSIRNFQRALGAQVVSFTNAASLAAEGSAVPGAVHVPVSDLPVAKYFYWAGSAARRGADRLAASADLLSCHMLYRYHAHWVGAWAARRHRPYWVVPHGSLDPYTYSYRAGFKETWMALYGRRFLTRASAVIFSTEQERRKAAAHYDGPNTRVIRWPINAPSLHGAAEARAQLRQKLGVGDEARLLLYLGRLHNKKRPLETVAAFAAARVSNAHLAIVGADENVTASQLRAEGERLGLRGRLHVPGPVYGPEKETWLHACDGFVSLSQQENFGYSAAEALSAGKPVILSPGNDLGGDLAPLNCGWILADDRPETASVAIAEWAGEPMEQLRERGERGRAFTQGELTFEKFAESLRELASATLAGN